MTGITLLGSPTRFGYNGTREMVAWEERDWQEMLEVWSHDPYVQNYLRNLYNAVCHSCFVF